MKEKIQILSKFPKVNMLIDGDTAGNKFKALCKDRDIKIVQLTDINKNFKIIENLFDNDDNNKPEDNKINQQDDSKKSSIINKNFKSIEKLFDNDDNNKPEDNKSNQQDDSKKSSIDKLKTKRLMALIFKQKILKESDEVQYSYPNENTKNNFNEVFKYIVDNIN